MLRQFVQSSKILRSQSRSICGTPVRQMAHVEVPEAQNDYKRDVSVTGSRRERTSAAESRRAFTYALVAAGGVVGASSAKVLVNDFLDTMSTSADVKALAEVEVELGAIEEGTNVVLKWQGKPLFVRHRTAAEIQDMQAVPMDALVDPQQDSDRVKVDKWLVVLGICTHLGCVPISHAGDHNGYFCPCHGSHYDASGRIRKGPAPENLEIPPYKFADDNTLVVG